MHNKVNKMSNYSPKKQSNKPTDEHQKQEKINLLFAH